MYNETVKQQFIENTYHDKTSISHSLTFFNAVGEQYEEPANLDIGDFSIDALYAMMSERDYITYTAVRNDVKILNAYRKWFAFSQHGVYKARGDISAQKIDLSLSMKKALIFEPDEIFQIRDVLPVTEGYSHIIAMILAWLGFSTDEMMELCTDAVRIEGTVLTVAGRSIDHADFADAMQIWLDHDSFDRGGKRVSKVNGEHLICRVPTENSAYRDKALPKNYVKDLLNAAQIYEEKPMTVHLLNTSGKMYRMLQYENGGGEVNKASASKIFETNVERRIFDCIAEYQQYKLARELD